MYLALAGVNFHAGEAHGGPKLGRKLGALRSGEEHDDFVPLVLALGSQHVHQQGQLVVDGGYQEGLGHVLVGLFRAFFAPHAVDELVARPQLVAANLLQRLAQGRKMRHETDGRSGNKGETNEQWVQKVVVQDLMKEPKGRRDAARNVQVLLCVIYHEECFSCYCSS